MSGLSIVAKGANLRTFEVVSVQKGTPGMMRAFRWAM